MKMDLHIHSKYSYDSFSNPHKILKIAKKKGFGAISITDHDTMDVYKKNSFDSEVLLIPGMEIKTDMGDVIGLFLNEEIFSRSFHDVVSEIKDQDGIVVLPHPYRRKCDPKKLIKNVDLIEVINSRSRSVENKRALINFGADNKKTITGSDAHMYFEIGASFTEMDVISENLDDLKSEFLHCNKKCYGGSTPFYLSHGCSFLISKFKSRCNF
jgi:hypothetical protein